MTHPSTPAEIRPRRRELLGATFPGRVLYGLTLLAMAPLGLSAVTPGSADAAAPKTILAEQFGATW